MGEIDDSETSRVQLGDITGDQVGQDCSNLDGCKPSTNQVTANSSEGESNSDDGFGEVRQTLKMYWSPFSITKTLDRRCLSFLVG